MRNLFPHATAPFFVIGIGRKPATEMERRSRGIEVGTAEHTGAWRKPATEMERRSRGIEVGTAEFAIRRVLAFFWELVFDFL